MLQPMCVTPRSVSGVSSTHLRSVKSKSAGDGAAAQRRRHVRQAGRINRPRPRLHRQGAYHGTAFNDGCEPWCGAAMSTVQSYGDCLRL